MGEAREQGVSAAMVLTDLIDNDLGKPRPSLAPVPYQEHEEQIDVIDWLERNG